MSDTTDIDIDAERKAYREWRIRVLRACGMYPGETDQRDTYRLDAWFERARIAAEREREMQRQYDAEKQSRVKYQELAYATMNAIDSFLGLNVRRGEGTTVDSFKANLQRMLDEIKRILFDWANAEVESADVGLLLKQAHAAVCSLQCPSVWPTNEPRPHCDLCRRITAALGTREDGE